MIGIVRVLRPGLPDAFVWYGDRSELLRLNWLRNAKREFWPVTLEP